MKRSIFLIVAAASFGLFGCAVFGGGGGGAGNQPAPTSFAPPGETVFDGRGSYALGMDVGMSFRAGGLFPNMDEFTRGVQDALRGEPRYSMEEAAEVFRRAYASLVGDRNRRMENEFLAANATAPGVVVTASGLQFLVLAQGNGPSPGPSDTVRVHYDGFLLDGTLFDSSRAMGGPAEFPLDAVIPGWTEGLQLMRVGSVHRLFVPARLAYGPDGMGPIPPYATLVFDVELLAILGN